MKRKKLVFAASVSASVLLVSSLLVACTAAEATGPCQSIAASSLAQVESVSASVSRADSSAPASSSQNASSNAASQSSRPASSSSAASSSTSSQAPVTQPPSSTAPQAQAPASQSECPPAPEPTPAPVPTPEPTPPPAPSANIDGCLSAAAGWASGNNMAVNDGLYIGGAGYENPIDTNGKTDAQVTEHLMYQLGLIHRQLTAMPEYDLGTIYPCYKFVVDGSMIYVLYG